MCLLQGAREQIIMLGIFFIYKIYCKITTCNFLDLYVACLIYFFKFKRVFYPLLISIG